MKSNTAALLVPELVTLAEVQAHHVVVLHTVIVAAVPVSHFSHFGIVKSNTAAAEVQELVTLASVHGFPVVVVPTAIVAAAHVAHVSPLSHFRLILASSKITVLLSSLVKTISSPLNAALTILAQVSHVSPCSHCSHLAHSGITKSNTAAHVVPEFVTLAELHGSHVVVLPTVIVAASHLSHFSPCGHVYHLGH